MTPAHKGQYMSSSATSNKVKLEGLPDNSPGVRGPYNEASPSLGRAQLRGWLVGHLLCPYPAGKRHTGHMVRWREGTEFNSQIAQSDIFQRRWPAWSAWPYLTWGVSRQSRGRSAGRWGGGDSGHSEIPVRAAWSEGNQLGPGTREWRDPRGTQRAVSHLAPVQPNNMAVEPRPQRG